MNENVPILLVEGNPDNVMISKMVFEEGETKNKLYVVRDGEGALNFLYKRGECTNVTTPGLILLDLNLPGVSGHEVSKEIKTADRLRRVPVIILTTSINDKDIIETYDLGANSYISKSAEHKDFIEIINSINDYWLKISKFPGE